MHARYGRQPPILRAPRPTVPRRRAQSTLFDGFETHWLHAACFLADRPRFGAGEVGGIDALRVEDQRLLRAAAAAAPGGAASTVDDEFSIGYAASGRAECRGCLQKIGKGEVRCSKLVEPGARARARVSAAAPPVRGRSCTACVS